MKQSTHKFPFEVKSISERKAEDSGEEFWIIEGILSTASVDQGDDIVLTEAMVKSFVDYGLPKFLHQHDGFSGMPLGTTTEFKLTEDNKIWIKSEVIKGITFNDDIVRKARHGEYGGLSIGYKALDVDWKDGIRIIKELRVRDASLVVFPMNEETEVTAVKSIEDLDSLKSVEQNLREEGGYSKKAVEAIISKIKSFSLGDQGGEENLGDQDDIDKEKEELKAIEEKKELELKEESELKEYLSTWLDEIKVNKED
jgi:HK97 family phage prohead protease